MNAYSSLSPVFNLFSGKRCENESWDESPIVDNGYK